MESSILWETKLW